MTDDNEGDVPLDKNPKPEQEAAILFESQEDREKRLRNEDLEQEIQERRKYAKRSFAPTCVWIGFVMISTTAQFVLNALGIGLDRYQFIALITTTTGSVLGFWLLVGRYLFRTTGVVASAPRGRYPSSSAGD